MMDAQEASQESRWPTIAKHIVGALILVALAAVFIYSGWSKIHTDNAFDNFQWTFLDLGINSLWVSGIVARLMIGMEFFIALMLLGHIYLKEFTYPAVLVILGVFIVYLILLLIKQGNTGDCGCFGDKLAMKPLTAIYKNLAMIAATLVLIYLYPIKPYKYQDFVLLVFGILSFTSPFLLNMMTDSVTPIANKRTVNLDLLYKYQPAPPIELRKGKHIIAFMSLTCPHCKKAAYLLQKIHREHPDWNLYMVLDGSKDHEAAFFKETQSMAVPHFMYHHTPEFIELAGPGVPSIYWFIDGKAVMKSEYAYYQLDPNYMAKWFATAHLK